MRRESALPGGSLELDTWHNSPELTKILKITWLLNGQLKNLQLSYLRVAVMLAQVRDEKLYRHMKHADMESYALEHLHLSDTSLYRYLRIHDWVKTRHPEWLEKKVKGRIPDLSDIDDLEWIEEELGRTGIDEKKEKALKELQAKALDGSLKRSDLRAFRKSGRTSSGGLRTFLSALRALIRRGGMLVAMPQEVMTHLNAAAGVLENLIKQA